MNHSHQLPESLSRLEMGTKSATFWTINATVLEAKVWSETRVSSSRNGNNQVASVYSRNVTKRELWVRLDGGKELCLSLPDNTSFVTRAGHPVSLICMKSPSLSSDSYYYMGIVNHAVESWLAMDCIWMDKKFAGTDNHLKQLLAVVFVLITYGLGIVPLWIYSRVIVRRYREPIVQRIEDIAKHCVRRGVPSQTESLTA